MGCLETSQSREAYVWRWGCREIEAKAWEMTLPQWTVSHTHWRSLSKEGPLSPYSITLDGFSSHKGPEEPLPSTDAGSLFFQGEYT